MNEKNQKIDNILKIAIAVLAIAVLAFVFLIVKTIYWPKKVVPRTPLERDLYQLQQILKKKPNDALAHNDLGVVYQRAGQYENALSEYKLALKYNLKLDKPHYNMAIIYLEEGKTAKAKDELDKTIGLNPGHAFANFELGKIAYSNKEYLKARDFFKKAIDIDSTTTDFRYWLGKAYEKLGDIKKAISTYKSILRYIPEDSNAKKALKRLEVK